MKYKGKVWILDEKVGCASQMCPSCPIDTKCVLAIIEPIEENPRLKIEEEQ